MILRAVERISRAQTLDGLVLATSVDPSDDELAAVAESAGVTVRRGSLDDVLGRFLTVVDEFEPTTVVRLTGDNPLIDPAVIDLIVREHEAHAVDYTSNAITRTFPRGLDVEAVRSAALRAMEELGPTAEEREHVTIGIYRRPERFRLHAVTQTPDRSELRWTVDHPDDLAFARAVYDELHADDPTFGQEDILRLIERRPELRRIDSPPA